MAKKKKAAPPGVVRASEFQLVDADGKLRALLLMSASGDPSLHLLDKKQCSRVVIELTGNGQPLVSLIDQTGRPALDLRISEHGPGIRFCDSAGMPGLVVQLFPDGSRAVVALNQAGETVWDKQWK
ncbi:MAG: hypothetical protein U0836_05915 [Pirellulales bacterium]